AVHFIRRNVDETLNLEFPCYLKKNECSRDVGLDYGSRLVDAPVHVRLGRKMDDRITAVQRRLDGRRVANVSFNKPIARIFLDRMEVCEVPSVCQFVVIDDEIRPVQSENMPDEVGTNE